MFWWIGGKVGQLPNPQKDFKCYCNWQSQLKQSTLNLATMELHIFEQISKIKFLVCYTTNNNNYATPIHVHVLYKYIILEPSAMKFCSLIGQSQLYIFHSKPPKRFTTVARLHPTTHETSSQSQSLSKSSCM